MALIRVRFNEGSSGYVRFQLTDQAGDAVLFDGLESGTLTLFDLDTFDGSVSPVEGVINNRHQQDILPEGSPQIENNVTYEDDGYVQWDVQPEDNVIVTARRQLERHRAVFHFTWDGGEFHQEIEIEVVNLRSVQ